MSTLQLAEPRSASTPDRVESSRRRLVACVAMLMALVASLGIVGAPWLPWLGFGATEVNGFRVASVTGDSVHGWGGCHWTVWYTLNCGGHNIDPHSLAVTGNLTFTGYSALAFAAVGAAVATVGFIGAWRRARRTARWFATLTVIISALSISAAFLTNLGAEGAFPFTGGAPGIHAEIGVALWLVFATLATVSAAVATAALHDRMPLALALVLGAAAAFVVVIVLETRDLTQWG